MFAVRASSGITLAFPDVCKIPAPPPPAGPGGIPIPYPNFAQTAVKSQKKTAGIVMPKKAVPMQGNEAGTSKGLVSSKVVGQMKVMGNPVVIGEISMLRGALTQLHNKLSTMSSADPNEWQTVLQDYAVAASALFVTLNSDDDD
jgi:hypothetical protein